MSCDGATGYSMLLSPFAVAVGGQKQETLQAQWSTGGQYDFTSASTWSSSNTAVATVQAGLGHGVSAGSVNFTAQDPNITDYTPYQCYGANMSCPIASGGGGTAPGYVGPYQVEPMATAAQGSANCPQGQAGWSRNVTNQVQHYDGTAFAQAGVSASDMIIISNTNALGISGTRTGTYTTTGDGSFPDTYFVCSSVCPGNTGETDAQQNWVVGSAGLPHVNQVRYKCSSITVDGY